MINTLGSTLRFGYDMRASLNNHTFTVDIQVESSRCWSQYIHHYSNYCLKDGVSGKNTEYTKFRPGFIDIRTNYMTDWDRVGRDLRSQLLATVAN